MAIVMDFPAPAGAALSPPLLGLIAATQQLSAQRPADIPGPQALVETQVLLAELDRLTAIALARIADVDRRGLAELDGAASTSTWVAEQQTGIERGDVALARRLDRFPLLAQSVFDGLGIKTAQRIASALTKLRPHLDRPDGLIDGQPAEAVVRAVICDGVLSLLCEGCGGLDDTDPRLAGWVQQLAEIASRPASELARLEAAFVWLGTRLEPGLLGSALERLVDACLPQQLQDDADRAHRDRELLLTRNYGGAGWTVSGQLDTECGELLHTVLTAQLATDDSNPADTAAWAAHRATGADTDEILELVGCHDAPRSIRQRRHDALKTGLRLLLDTAALGQRGKAAPHLDVIVSLAALHTEPGALPAVGGSGHPLPLSLVQQWLCDSYLTRFVLGLGGRVQESSHTKRTAKAHERRVKRVETGGRCQGAGCPRGPDAALVPHHVIAWSLVGTTSLADTVMLCEQAHHDLHIGGKTLKLRDGRYVNAAGWVDPTR